MPEDPEEQLEEPSTPRPFWSGTLSFGLVSIPVNLFPGEPLQPRGPAHAGAERNSPAPPLLFVQNRPRACPGADGARLRDR